MNDWHSDFYAAILAGLLRELDQNAQHDKITLEGGTILQHIKNYNRLLEKKAFKP